MEISAEEAAALLGDKRNLAERQPTFIRSHNGSRGGNGSSGSNGGKEIPHSLRVLIGASAHHDTIASVAGSFGVSPSTVAAAKAGRVGVNRFDEELKEEVEKAAGVMTDSVRDAALERLAQMFAGVINEQNLNTLKPREAVSAARDLATVVDKLTPKQKAANVAVFVHAPRVKDEAEYGNVIEVQHKPMVEKKLT